MIEGNYGKERREHNRRIDTVEESFDRKLREHEAREQERFNIFISSAFPDGADSHRLAHQAMIDAAKSEKEFWQGLKADIAKKSIWGILQILIILTVAGVAAKFGLGAVVAGVAAK